MNKEKWHQMRIPDAVSLVQYPCRFHSRGLPSFKSWEKQSLQVKGDFVVGYQMTTGSRRYWNDMKQYIDQENLGLILTGTD